MIGKNARLPTHVAIVPDGNGRWAELRGLPRLSGHHAGAENMRHMVEYLSEYPIKYVTLYGFSTENWSRPEDEVRGLFSLLEEFINQYVLEIHKRGIKLRHIGRLNELPQGLQLAINRAVELTKNNNGMTLNVAFNYGGRVEILDAVRRLIAEGVSHQNIDEGLFSNYLYTDGLPDVDLLIRTGDELRLSNFLIWQTAYSEYYFTEVLWPDFSKKEIEKALLSYSQRQRRFGGL
ncbi:MAG TPA: di-trans,poly-cis-decaprenylcistransferase [Dehalococcoidia bacterium]|jgi:undecaprenyl diphosphate synthase|nr:di-trans,poly-cis-decaprenylcistransferase [Dehalococcoidia bacterium]